jgi:hypothetical protein
MIYGAMCILLVLTGPMALMVALVTQWLLHCYQYSLSAYLPVPCSGLVTHSLLFSSMGVCIRGGKVQ